MTTETTVDAASHRKVDWHGINWSKIHRNVRRLQRRIVKATQERNYREVKALQRLLSHSYSGRAQAVRRVTENTGKKTAGIDGQTWDTPEAKGKAVQTLRQKGYKARPLRRVHIKKASGKGYRKLGIPTMKDRAMQALYLLGLQPVAETLAAPNSYGFRPERSCADAIQQCYMNLAKKGSAQWILEADIKACFDEISHEWMEANIPMDTSVLRKWLKAGYMQSDTLFPTKKGTPQGAIISPCLANMALDGLEEELDKKFPQTTTRGRLSKVHIVRYADDFVITGSSKELLETEVKPIVVEILKERGLELSADKTNLTHIEEGFDFLGQNIRKYGVKLLIKPSEKSQKALLQKVKWQTLDLRGAPQCLLISKLNEITQGWANYHRHVVSKKVYEKLDQRIRQAVWKWAKRRHPKKGTAWIKTQYYRKIRGRSQVFASNEIDETGKYIVYILRKLADTPIERHTKIKGNANPFDPAWELYFERRTDYKMRNKLREKKRLTSLYKRQDGICPNCHEKLDEERGWDTHHIIRQVDGGKDTLDNLVLLHPNCHRQVHARCNDGGVTGSQEAAAFCEA